MYKFESLACKCAAFVHPLHLLAAISRNLQKKRFMTTEVVAFVNNVADSLFICRSDLSFKLNSFCDVKLLRCLTIELLALYARGLKACVVSSENNSFHDTFTEARTDA